VTLETEGGKTGFSRGKSEKGTTQGVGFLGKKVSKTKEGLSCTRKGGGEVEGTAGSARETDCQAKER